ncbi:hypothetical protein [Brevibacillus halotolerans]|uniref:hypothetical protein n=1 Tax=Brevibacillus halotolerans TaxID=1507437 RepID=UPI001BB432B6|nr:hypothetical protein [Brevibacillus halotolerans]
MGWLKDWLPLIVFLYTIYKDFIHPKMVKKKKQKRRPRQGKRLVETRNITCDSYLSYSNCFIRTEELACL